MKFLLYYTCIMYAAFAFIAWDFNPANWTKCERAFAAGLATVLTIIFIEMNDKPKGEEAE